MNYEKTLERIHYLNKFGSRPGLERIKMLLDMLGNPQDSLKFVHVAGTNGKGSVCQMISSVLNASGYKTGLFISPYVTDFRERIQIDNTLISKDDLCSVVDYVFSFVEMLREKDIIITEFEFVMAVSFEFFKRECVDAVVCETGLGGLLDCTNVIKPPLCAVLTSISLDHTDILGDTIEKIAEQKCGIIKSGSQVVSDIQGLETKKIIEKTCEDREVPLTFADKDEFTVLTSDLSGTKFLYKNKEYIIKLLGEHQLNNCAVAVKALEALKSRGFEISEDNLREGLLNAKNPARQEVMRKEPLILLDGAHNADGMASFAKGVEKYCVESKPLLIIGMLADKDSRGSLEFIKGLFDRVFTVPINNPRAMKSEDMAALCREYFHEVEACGDIVEALNKALTLAEKEKRALCICGSLYLAGEIRPLILDYLKK